MGGAGLCVTHWYSFKLQFLIVYLKNIAIFCEKVSDWHEVSLLSYVFLIETCVDIDASVSKNKEDHKAGKVEPEEGIHIESKRVPDKASNTTLEPFHYDSDGDDVLDKSLNKKSNTVTFYHVY